MPSAMVVGSGPNGLAAAITLGQAGIAVTLVEAAGSIGGGLRSGESTLPGLLHDHCAAIAATAVASPFMQTLDLQSHGVRWAWPEIELVHPLDGGAAGVLYKSLDTTAAALGVPTESAGAESFSLVAGTTISSPKTCYHRSSSSRDTPSVWGYSDCRRRCQRQCLPATSRHPKLAHCSPVTPRTPGRH